MAWLGRRHVGQELSLEVFQHVFWWFLDVFLDVKCWSFKSSKLSKRLDEFQGASLTMLGPQQPKMMEAAYKAQGSQ